MKNLQLRIFFFKVTNPFNVCWVNLSQNEKFRREDTYQEYKLAMMSSHSLTFIRDKLISNF
jgi:hypothetical protein